MIQNLKTAAAGGTLAHRALLAIVYSAGFVLLAHPALEAFSSSVFAWSDVTRVQGFLLILVPAAALFESVLSSKRHSLAWSIYWTWSLVFLGLAAAYQITANAFPWKGVLLEEDIITAQRVVLVAHATVLVTSLAASRRRTPDAPAAERVATDSPSLLKAVMTIIIGHALITTLFCGLVGPALFTGRLAFQSRLAGLEGVPGFGSMYFLSNAGAIVIPAMAILLRKTGLNLPGAAVFLSVAVSFLATNPLIGSRFLTGSFLVAVVAASVGPNARRWIPAGTIFAFVTVFPTLDLLRGDGTGATSIRFTPPSETLANFDYDSFEMLVREVSLDGNTPGGLPTTLDLLIAPFLRWVPVLSQSVKGDASGPVVAMSTDMTFTNVSMPLWGEAHLIGSWFGVVMFFLILGTMLHRTRIAATSSNGGIFGMLVEMPLAALLFIVLRGSLYEVLGYVILAAILAYLLARTAARERSAFGMRKNTWIDPFAQPLPAGRKASKTPST